MRRLRRGRDSREVNKGLGVKVTPGEFRASKFLAANTMYKKCGRGGRETQNR